MAFKIKKISFSGPSGIARLFMNFTNFTKSVYYKKIQVLILNNHVKFSDTAQHYKIIRC